MIIGGILFGYGMMVSDGCTSRHLVKMAQGEKDSFYILISLSLFAFFTYELYLHFNKELFDNLLFQSTMAPTNIHVPIFLLVITLSILVYKNIDHWRNILECWDGIFIGVLISFGWFATTIFIEDSFVTISAQSLSFVYPMGEVIDYIAKGFDNSILVFSIWTLVGVIVGAFISKLTNKQFSKKFSCSNSYQNPPTLSKKLIGGAFMGIGGTMAIGCTVGQGLSGISTLSMTSILATLCIYITAFITAKYMHKNNSLIACFVFDFKSK
jgi:uncharacterized membrane protein YedE/YeeE